MKKKILFLWVLLSTAVCTFAYDYDYDFKSGDLYYNITGYHTVEVTYQYSSHSTEANYSKLTSVIIPESVTYKGITYSVTSIGDNAFYGCRGLTSVTIPNSVTSIGDYAFYGCRGLTSVTIPNSVTNIGADAFYGCRGLTSITIPNSVTSIGDYAFYGCRGLTSITIPNSVTSVKYGTFSGCSSLTAVTIPNSVTSIERRAFYGCSGLTSITIGKGVTSIEDWAFYGCSSLTSIVWNAKDYAVDFASQSTPFYYYESSGSNNFDLRPQITSFIFGDSAQHIPAYICSDMDNLTSVTIGNSVTSIGDNAFYGCSGLTSITIPNSVTSIGGYAFYGCSGLTSITIPNSVTSIGGYAFYGCSGLTSVIWNAKNCAGWDSYREAPFYGIKDSITSFTFGNEVESIPDYLCDAMSKLTSIVIPNSVKSIGKFAFYGCSGLTSVTIPNSVTSIGNGAFRYVLNIAYNGTATGSPWGAKSINGYVDGYLIYADATKATLLTCSSAVTGEITISDSVTSIGNSAFYGCSGLTSITIPNSVTSIGNSAFYGCSGLTSITIPNSVTSIGSSAFRGCSGLISIVWNATACADFTESPFAIYATITSFVFGDSVQHIPAYICKGMRNLTSITIPSNVTRIGNRAFTGCSSLTSVVWNAKACGNWYSSQSAPFYDVKDSITSFVFGNEVEMIPLCICEAMSKLTSITIPNSVTSIGGYAFYGCSGLTSITIPDSVTSIRSGAFRGCSSLTSIVIPDRITYIEESAFEGCSSLTSATIGNSVTRIGNKVFKGCSNLTSIVWNAKKYTISQEDNTPFYRPSDEVDLRSQITSFVFGDGTQDIPAYICSGMSNLTSLTMSNGVTNIRSSAFRGCSGLTSIMIPNSVWGIGSNAFEGCTGLTSVVIPDNVGSIGEYAFHGCTSLTSVTIPNSVLSIGGNAFDGCIGLTSVAIPDSVVSIGEYAFRDCTSLTSVTIPSTVTNVGTNAFGNCDNLTSVVWRAKRFRGQYDDYSSSPFYSEKGSNITSFSFGKEVKSIPNYLCYEMKNLTSVVIPNSVESIGDEAFRNCRALISVTMGKNVTYIGYRAFDGTYWLNNQRDGLIYMNTVLYGYKGVMPQGTNIVVREGTTEIGNNALAGCTGLTSITIPNSVTNIQDSAFYDCSSLDSITIPNSVTTIGQYAFSACGNLTFAAIGSNVARIGQNAFGGCDNLTSVVWNSKYYRDLSSDLEAPFYDARQKITSVILGNEVEHIPAYLCYGMNRLDSITIPASVTSIGKDVFSGCNGLTKTNHTGDVAGWYRMRFDNRQSNPIECSHNLFLNDVLVTELVVPKNLYIINDAFSRDTCLISVVIPDGVKAIGETAFYDCTRLTDVSISNSVTSIGERAFQNCYSLNSLAIPNGVTTIGNSAFANCTGLSSLFIPNSVTNIESSAFYGCRSLISVTIPGSIKRIAPSLFSGCTGLTSVIISDGVTSVGDEAFRGCTRLTYVTCYATEPPSISSNAFYGVKVDTIPLYVPMESMVKYNSSDVWKDFLVLPISAMPVDVDEPILNPEENKVTITWPAVEDAIAYTIEISNDSALVCTLVFDASGALKNMHYAAPARCAAQHTTQAETTGYGFRFVVEGLDYATTYTYTITATDIDDAVLVTYTGTFTTTGYNPTTDTEDIRSAQSQPATRKVFRNGQVLILRGDKTYTLTGEEL